MTTYADSCLERANKAPLRSDDHGHDTSSLREYCEIELCYAYDVMVPELANRLKRACEYLRCLEHRIGYSIADELELADELERMPE